LDLKSIGARLVSAIIAIRNNKETGKRGAIYQIDCCDSIIWIILKEPEKKTTMRINKLKKTSYAQQAKIYNNKIKNR